MDCNSVASSKNVLLLVSVEVRLNYNKYINCEVAFTSQFMLIKGMNLGASPEPLIPQQAVGN